MGHSVREYLEKQPTPALKMILYNFSKADDGEEYDYAKKIIEEILENREE